MTTREATCSCGRLRATVEGDPVRVTLCHCFSCQQRSGSPFGVLAIFTPDQATITGESRPYTRYADDGGAPRTQHFCPECGSTVYCSWVHGSDMIAVPVGAFADPDFPAPVRSLWSERRHHWIDLPGSIPHQ